MSERLVTLERYRLLWQAQIAANALEAAGIRCFLMGEEVGATLPGLETLGSQVSLQVAAGQAREAAEVLARLESESHPDPDWEDEAEREAGVWVCTLCGAAVDQTLGDCPDCRTPRDALRPAPGRRGPTGSAPEEAIQPPKGVRPPGPHEPTDQESTGKVLPIDAAHEDRASPDPSPETHSGDELARYAFRCALFGFLMCPFLPYSLWLQYRLSQFPGEFSPIGWRYFYATVALNAFWVACAFVLGGLASATSR